MKIMKMKKLNIFTAFVLTGVMLMSQSINYAYAYEPTQKEQAVEENQTTEAVNQETKEVNQATEEVNQETKEINQTTEEAVEETTKQETTKVEEITKESTKVPVTTATKTAGDNDVQIQAENDAIIVAKIGNKTYSTLDEAINEVTDNQEIELQSDATLTVNTINKPVTILGNAHTVTVPKQPETENGILIINNKLTFYNTNVKFGNDSKWSISMNSSGVLNLYKGTTCTIEKYGIYTNPNATINVDNSTLKMQGIGYTAIMAEDFANMNVTNGSTVSIKNVHDQNNDANGITSVKIKVSNSKFEINDIANQGLVKCELDLEAGAIANISETDIGMTGFNDTNVLTMHAGSSLNLFDNKSAGIFLWGGNVHVQKGSELNITNTGSDLTDPIDNPYCGGIAVRYSRGNGYANLNFEDGATVNILNNGVSGIHGDGDFYLGSGTTIMYNGFNSLYGGGIHHNIGTITMSDAVKLYNNHAATAGDDVYNTGKGIIQLEKVGEDWMLEDCDPEHAIDGWYEDGNNENGTRWNADDKETRYVELQEPGKMEGVKALKAAHGVLKYKVTVNYLDVDSNEKISESNVTTVEFKDPYDVTNFDKIKIDGYTYVKTEGNLTCDSTEADSVINVYYKKIQEPPKDEPTKDEPTKDQPTKDESKNVYTTKDTSKKDPKTGDEMNTNLYLGSDLFAISAAIILAVLKYRVKGN